MRSKSRPPVARPSPLPTRERRAAAMVHGELRLDRIVGRIILPRALTRNFALAQRAIDSSALISMPVPYGSGRPTIAKGRTIIGGAGQ